MKWVEGTALDGARYTALKSDDETREFGRYWHRSGGFVPATPKNNAAIRPTHGTARDFVLRKAIEKVQAEAVELSLELGKCSTSNMKGNEVGSAEPRPTR